MSYQQWRARLAKANNPAFLPITYIDELVHEDRAQFWATDHAAMVTDLVAWPGGAVTIRAIAAAGRMKDIIGELGDAVLAWGKANGATHAMVPGRDGWKRKRPDFWHYQTIIVKEL